MFAYFQDRGWFRKQKRVYPASWHERKCLFVVTPLSRNGKIVSRPLITTDAPRLGVRNATNQDLARFLRASNSLAKLDPAADNDEYLERMAEKVERLHPPRMTIAAYVLLLTLLVYAYQHTIVPLSTRSRAVCEAFCWLSGFLSPVQISSECWSRSCWLLLCQGSEVSQGFR